MHGGTPIILKAMVRSGKPHRKIIIPDIGMCNSFMSLWPTNNLLWDEMKFLFFFFAVHLVGWRSWRFSRWTCAYLTSVLRMNGWSLELFFVCVLPVDVCSNLPCTDDGQKHRKVKQKVYSCSSNSPRKS